MTIFARLVIGGQGVAMMTEMCGSSNSTTKRELRWQPAYGSSTSRRAA